MQPLVKDSLTNSSDKASKSTLRHVAPLVSVIVAAYGQEAYISEALESLQAMSMTDWEAIVIDDGSPDKVMDVVAKFAAVDPRIRPLYTDNHGVGAARNIAVSHARGRYITFLDGDDAFYPTYLANAIGILEQDPEVMLVYGMWEYFGANYNTPPLAWHGYGTLLLGNSIHVSAVVRLADFLAIGGFDATLRSHEDWELWIRLLQDSPDSAVRFLSDPSLLYRQKPISRNNVSLASELYPSIVSEIYNKHRNIYNDIFEGLVSPPIISMRGVSGTYKWTALRQIKGLKHEAILETTCAFTNLLDFIERNKILSRCECNRLARKGMVRLNRNLLWLSYSLPIKVSARLLRQFIISSF